MRHANCIDTRDASSDALHLLVWQALKSYSVKGLITLLDDRDTIVRTAAARELHLRGGSAAFAKAAALAKARKPCDRALGMFLLSQLGTPRIPLRSRCVRIVAQTLRKETSTAVKAEALYALSHLKQGARLSDLDTELYRHVMEMRPRRGSALARARSAALAA